MKFIVFLAFVATISATTVNISSKANCEDLHEAYNSCGFHDLLAEVVTYALITDNKEGVVFYDSEDCTGKEYEVKGPVPGKKCYDLDMLLPFVPRCIDIVCGDSGSEVSCHIVTVVLWSILTRLI